MAIKADLVIRHHGCVSEQMTDGTSMAQIAGERGSELFLLHADDEAELADALAACEAYVDNTADVIDRTPTSAVFRGVNSPGGTIAAIRQSPCQLLWPVVYRDGLEHFTLLAGSREEISDLVHALKDEGDVRIRELSQVEPEGIDASVPLADLTSGLTARQLQALLLAVKEGYYETPRRASIGSLAEAFEVGPSTFSEHLRKAEGSLLGRLAKLVSHHEVLARSAKKGPGRPPDP